MSQVIVTDDDLRERRQQTRKQELSIDKEGYYQQWRIAKVTQMRPLAMLIGLASVPVIVFWSILLIPIAISLSVFIGVLKFLGRIFGFRKTN